MATSKDRPIPVESIEHRARRANIPTEELRDFVAEEERAPATLLYPRDPSLDPQLVWKGKDEQDRQDLAVPVVPIYIQEKIEPRAIVEQVRAAARGDTPQQASLFDRFDDLDFEERIDFYHHEQQWTNRMILGDSLLVMSSLAEKEGLRSKVQMIYLDPPYGISFRSNWQVSTRKRDVRDSRTEDISRQPEQVRAFRDTWKLGIHSYLTYLRDRLLISRELLSDSGSIFVQIGAENVHVVRCLLEEVFGGETFVSQISFQKTTGQDEELLNSTADYLLWYRKNTDEIKYRDLFSSKYNEYSNYGIYQRIEMPDGSRRSISQDEHNNPDSIPDRSRRYSLGDTSSSGYGGNKPFPFDFQGKTYLPTNGRHWSTNEHGMLRLAHANRLVPSAASLRYVRFLDDFAVSKLNNIWQDTGVGQFTDPKIYVVQTLSKIVQRCILMTTDPGDLVLDPTCGSGTTAYVAEQWGRRWITCDTSRVALALARTRLMAAKYPYYLLADSPEGIKKETEVTGQRPPDYPTANDVRKGFVYKRVPHVTLKSIANNVEIDEIHAHWQERLEPTLARLNELLGESWEEWQVPREAGEEWSGQAKELLAEWWQSRRERQAEIDASIARHADVELLYDQPYEDPKRIRVSGPFTVESLSPHRVLSTDEERPESEREAQRAATVGQFETMVLDNLKKAGVQNTVKSERLVFERLEPYAGEWLHAAGEYADKDGLARRVAISIGPEHGTVGPEQVKEAAKEALRGVGFDLLVVCGFAFDAHAGETANEFKPDPPKKSDDFAVAEATRQYGKLPVLLARMNPDLAMGDELLKKTGAGNLFMVFGEPDIVVERRDGKLVLEIKGLDVYDPTTGEVRSSTTDDIACWFVDTDYNGESFFVRQAYFTGADEPYEKLKRALKAEIDEAAWSALYSTRSRPFDPPQSGKIAVKVINHYGDEVLKVFQV